jgi:hypothetical protein
MNTVPAAAALSPSVARWLSAAVALWLAAVCWAALSGALSRLHLPWIAALVAAGIVLPTAAYFRSTALQALAERVGLRGLTLLHLWRVPAAMTFYAYGLAGELPPLFWLLAGTGDLIAGLYAAGALRAQSSRAYYRRFHAFGFADFVVAVGTGLAYTLMLDPRMAPIALWPMALIPMFGVGLSGAAHLVAFDLLRRGHPR